MGIQEAYMAWRGVFARYIKRSGNRQDGSSVHIPSEGQLRESRYIGVILISDNDARAGINTKHGL